MKFLLYSVLLEVLMCSCQEKSNKNNVHESTDVSGQELVEKTIRKTFDPSEHPLIFRRTTLIVRDIEKSLALYQDAIGMEIIYGW